MICFYDDEEEYSEFDLAWKTKDWDKLSELSEQWGEKPENQFFNILNNINFAKKEMCVNNMGYSKWAVDSMLSKSADTITAAYYANLFLHKLPDQIHHDYLLHMVPQAKRYAKTTKLDESYKDTFIIKLLAKFYKVNLDKAFQYKILLEKKQKLDLVLKQAKPLVDDAFLKTVTKNVKEQKELKKLL